MEILKTFKNHDQIIRTDTVIAACFKGKRHVLSTAPLNGGYHEDLRWILNQDCKPHDGSGEKVKMKGKDYKSHVEAVCREMGFLPEYTSGIITAADMQNAAICTKSFQDVSVTAVITGGIDDNGGRVGDIASWHERKGEFFPVVGTINIFLFIEANLTPGAMARVIMTATEAKVSVIQELFAPSLYSTGLATGSGTDGIIVVSDAESDICLSEAGKHYKLGELIGNAVRDALREALYLQSGLCAVRQFDIFRRLGRFGITRSEMIDWIYEYSNMYHTQEISKQVTVKKQIKMEKVLEEALRVLNEDEEFITYITLCAHILDQIQWGAIPEEAAKIVMSQLLQQMTVISEKGRKKQKQKIENIYQTVQHISSKTSFPLNSEFLEQLIEIIQDCLKKILLSFIQ